jgi:TolB-like protein
VPLQRQPARLLELLVAKPGDLVTREEIRQALWGDGVHVDFERSLNFCVRKLRSALEDDASAPRFVETIPTRGYRFIAAAEQAEYGAGVAAGRLSSRGAVMWAVIVALLLGAGGGFAISLHRGAGPPPPKVVVVPFHNETGSADFDRVAKGVSDAAVARLAAPDRLPRLLVIGNASDVYFSFHPRDMKAMGQALGAQYLVLGQVKKDDRRFRVIAHLIRVSDQTHVWATTFDRESLDLAAQADLAERIAAAVAAKIPRA